MNDGVTDVSLHAPTVCDDECSPTLDTYTKRFQHRAGNPSQLATGVNERVGYITHIATREVLDADRRTKQSHVRHDTLHRPTFSIITSPVDPKQC